MEHAPFDSPKSAFNAENIEEDVRTHEQLGVRHNSQDKQGQGTNFKVGRYEYNSYTTSQKYSFFIISSSKHKSS